MTQSHTKTFDIPLSPYGYGMMALSTAIVVLLINGFFQKWGADLFATWFTVILAGASGALAVALIRGNLPALQKPLAITYTTVLFIVMLCCYLTSFFGYSQAYILYFLQPFPEKVFSFQKFMHGLEHVWLAVTGAAFVSTIVYVIISTLSPSKKSVQPFENSIVETDGLAE